MSAVLDLSSVPIAELKRRQDALRALMVRVARHSDVFRDCNELDRLIASEIVARTANGEIDEPTRRGFLARLFAEA